MQFERYTAPSVTPKMNNENAVPRPASVEVEAILFVIDEPTVIHAVRSETQLDASHFFRRKLPVHWDRGVCLWHLVQVPLVASDYLLLCVQPRLSSAEVPAKFLLQHIVWTIEEYSRFGR